MDKETSSLLEILERAYKITNIELSEEVKEAINALFSKKSKLSAEEIQDKIEEILMQDNRDLAKVFIIERYKASQIEASEATNKDVLDKLDIVLARLKTLKTILINKH